MTTEHTEKFKELVDGIHVTMLTTVASDGRLVSRPMGVSEVGDDGTVWFFTEADSAKVHEFEREPEVNVAFTSGTTWVSLAGRASLVNDQAKLKELWNSAAEAWMPEGPESPNARLLKVTPESAEYWDTPGGRAMTALSFVKAKVTGERLDSGDNEVIDL